MKPAPPPRTTTLGVTSTAASSTPKVTFKGAKTWRESLAALLLIALGVALILSLLTLALWSWRHRSVYDELVDYLDKTISIAKINHVHGLYQPNVADLDVIAAHKRYKTILWCGLGSELVLGVLLAVALMIYFSSDVARGTPHVIFLLLAGILAVLAVIEISVTALVLWPFSPTLANGTTRVLDRSIPHNPGGLAQMESRLDCSFHYDLYHWQTRRVDPLNTCDPQISSSFAGHIGLILLWAARILPVILIGLLFLKRTPISETAAQLVERLKGVNADRRPVDYGRPKTTTFGTIDSNTSTVSALRPPTSPAVQSAIDHSISYNNAAFVATQGAGATTAPGYGTSSSRASSISAPALDAIYRSHNVSHNAVSEV